MKCQVCGVNESTQTHHLFGGANRQNSEKYKDICTIRVCFRCHRAIHDGKLNKLVEIMRRNAQLEFEEKYSHEEFMNTFRRNYL